MGTISFPIRHPQAWLNTRQKGAKYFLDYAELCMNDHLDSLDQLEEEAKEWLEKNPHSPAAHYALAVVEQKQNNPHCYEHLRATLQHRGETTAYLSYAFRLLIKNSDEHALPCIELLVNELIKESPTENVFGHFAKSLATKHLGKTPREIETLVQHARERRRFQ